jgi:hypothetical protein
MIMNKQTRRRSVALAVASAVVFGAGSASWAAPVLSSTAALKDTAPSAVSDVRYRGHRHYDRRNGAGIALGILGVAGAVAGAAAYDHGYYGDRGYDRQGYYGERGYARQGYDSGGPYYGAGRGPNDFGRRETY